jgi:hypothetical protein
MLGMPETHQQTVEPLLLFCEELTGFELKRHRDKEKKK